MKPATLEPYIPLHLPLIWGPDPSAGSSYGCYQNEQKTMVVSKKQESVYCPITGKKMKFIGDIDAMEFEKASADIKKHSVCSNCHSDIFSNFDVSKKFCCWNCGHSLEGEKKTMSKKIKEIRKSIEAKISLAEEGEFVSIDTLLTELDKGKEPKVEEPKVEEKPEEPSKDESKETAEEPTEAAITTADEPPKDEESKDKKEEPEEKSEEDTKEEPKSEESKDSEEKTEDSEPKSDEPKSDKDSSPEKKTEETEVKPEITEEVADQITEEVADQIADQVSDEVKEIAEEVSEQVSEEVKEHIEDTIEDMNDLNEEEKKETEEEKKDMVDLDIVLSMAKAKREDILNSVLKEKAIREAAFKSFKSETEKQNKKSEEIMRTEKEKTIARLRAKAKANILKKRVEADVEMVDLKDVIAMANKAVAEEIVEIEPAVETVVESPIQEAKKEEFEILEVPATDVPAAPKAEELSMTTPNDEVAVEESEALRYETLSSLEEIKTSGKDNVELVLFNERTNNPTWMVFCKASPLAKIECQAQADAEDIKEVFASEDFAKDFVNHCADIGLIKSLQNVNATFFANETSDKKIADRYEAKAEAKIAKFKAQAETKLRNDLVKALDVVTVGMNKNLYSDVGHPLKDALFEGMTLAGVPENTAVSVVNAAFATGAAAYYQVVFEKAIAFMNMNETAQSELKQMISDASVINNEVNENEMSLNERLSKASSVASLRPYDVNVRPSISIDRDSYKARLKATMKK